MAKSDGKQPEGALSGDRLIEDQAREQTGQRQIRVRVDERDVQTSYVSGFRPVVGSEEVILDLGLNHARPTGRKEEPVELVFEVKQRVILSPYNAKRLAMSLGEVVRRYEQEFGQIELDAAKRRRPQR